MSHDLLKARYGAQVNLPELSANPVIERMLAHRSVRAFLPTPVTEAQLQTMMAAAQSVASSSNLNVWSVVAVTAPDVRQKLSLLAGDQAHIREAPLQLLWVLDLSRLRAICEAEKMPSEGLDYLEMYTVGCIDTAIAAQNAVLAAESMGLGTVYIGGMRNHPDEVAALVGLPPQALVLFGMSVGTPDSARPSHVKPRPAQSFVLHREHYQHEAAAPAITAYNQTMSHYYADHQMAVKGHWGHHSAKRVTLAGSLNGREKLREHLYSLGFKLK